MYYVIYDYTCGFNIYSEVNILYMDLNDYCIEYEGSKEECIEYLKNLNYKL